MVPTDQLEICSFDDLSVEVHGGALTVRCPACGPVRVVCAMPTLSDLTNAAIVHLESHPEAHRHAA
jgi:hypothetical protein